jgi:glycosyltransferase involved in cell wall biosynthesis
MRPHEPEPPRLDLSVVVPVYNEVESLPALLREVHAALRPTGRSYEVVLVDDGSTDGSARWLEEAAAADPSLVIVRFRRNFGQTAAMQAGFDHARGELIATLDADLQNDPADIPTMARRLEEEGFDLVAGWRANRQDKLLSRRLPSVLANRLISYTTNVKLHDYGCTLKVMRGEVAKELRLYGEMHRFIPAIASWMGVRVLEVPVNHRARVHGVSKYGIGRTTRVVLDLITVLFIQRYLARPMQVFGMLGLASFALGAGISGWLAFEKLVWGMQLADRPLLLLGVLLIMIGIQLLSLGLVADIGMRTYHEAQGKPVYYVRTVVRGAGYVPEPLKPAVAVREIVSGDGARRQGA